LSELPALAARVEAYGVESGLTEKEIFQFNLVLEELITNIVKYGYRDSAEHVIDVELWLDGGWIRAEVTDDACPFHPAEACRPDLGAPLQQRPVGGLGMHLVQELMDEVTYESENSRNRLRLGKRRKGGD
jgi:anti-sigma regulatory factor (Ser/Thr protein kinase)